MFKSELCSNADIEKINKYLCKIEGQFLNRLHFWSSHRNGYGIERKDMVWIYNTLSQWAEQLNVSKSSIRRAIKSLKDKGIISSAYLSANRRNRTLYYAINHDVIKKIIPSARRRTCAQNRVDNEHINERINEHINEHMYTDTYTDTESNKSNKSSKSSKSNKASKKVSSEESKPTLENKSISPIPQDKPKNTTAQDMLAIWNKEMNQNDSLTAHFAKYLVAAIQQKFENSLELWRKYLKRIKTSAYLMGEKFKLWLSWILKFSTIDKILAGGFSTREPEKSLDDQKADAETHIASLNEEPECLQIRRNFVKYHGSPVYMAWLAKATLRKIIVQDSCRQEEFLAVSVKSDFAFERLRTYLKSHVTGGLAVDYDNHFQKQENKTEQVEQAKPEQSGDGKMAIAETKTEAEAHIASLSEEPECLQIRRNFVEHHGPSVYMAWLAEVTLRKITVQYLHGCKERIAISMKNAELFESLRTRYMGSYITGGFEVDDKNHFEKPIEKPELSAEKIKPEITRQKQLKTYAADRKIESGSLMQAWPRGKGKNLAAMTFSAPKTQPVASIGDCCAMLIQNLSSKIPQYVRENA
ncbi:MAG: helix-turn-helix domain-containing protein [Holosporaceae bacterium]|jgi:DNA-binding transcriptional regulator GbsR (MarR family)|nr:helix-turn-helix domain-containing protein [Holosporaceae bacterium]